MNINCCTGKTLRKTFAGVDLASDTIFARCCRACWRGLDRATAMICCVTSRTVPAITKVGARISDVYGASVVKFDSHKFEFFPFCNIFDMFRSLLLKNLGVIDPSDLGVSAAGVVNLALDQFGPVGGDNVLGVLDSSEDRGSEFSNSLSPNFLDSFSQQLKVVFTAKGTLVASFEKWAMLFFHLCKGSLINFLFVGADEGDSLIVVPTGKLCLNSVEVVDVVNIVISHDLAHITS